MFLVEVNNYIYLGRFTDFHGCSRAYMLTSSPVNGEYIYTMSESLRLRATHSNGT